jgi:PAT family beta-lactamase induction signal transducer AmpG
VAPKPTDSTSMGRTKKLLIVSVLYFAEGFPYGLIEQTFPIYFRVHGMSLAPLGFLSLLSLPYALKFFWAPAVDFLGARRHWIVAAQFCMAAALLLLIPLNPSEPVLFLWVVMGAFAVLSATQDIAVDAYTIELLQASEMGIANGFRQAAYRMALVIAGGLFIALGGWIGWKPMFVCASVVLLCCAVASLKLPRIDARRPPISAARLLAPVRDLLARPGLFPVVAFILLYKLGDLAMGPMVRPFWLAYGLTTTEIGLITGSIGVASSIVGGLAGGLFMARFGIFHGLWFLGIWQAVSNLSYAWIATLPPGNNSLIYAASAIESFCAGLGAAAFLAFLMVICSKEFSATQYALLSALFRATGILAGSLSGIATDSVGFSQYFGLTFLLSLPSFVFLPWVRRWIPLENGAGIGTSRSPART